MGGAIFLIILVVLVLWIVSSCIRIVFENSSSR